MFRKVEDFIAIRKLEAANTLKVFDAIPDAHSGQAVADGHWSLKRLAWHLVESMAEMAGRIGLEVDVDKVMTDNAIADPPATMTEVKAAYEKASSSLLKNIEAWPDEHLLIEDDMYGEKWTRSTTLGVIVCHEIHHRGEMIVLMRLAGLVPPGVYGPAKEEWASFGMEAPQV